MNRIDQGTIAARSIGLLLLIIGTVALIDFAIHFQQSKQVLSDSGWTNYTPLQEPKDDPPLDTFLHDTFFVISPTISPFASGLFVVIGTLFLVFSGSIGRLIAGKNSSLTEEREG